MDKNGYIYGYLLRSTYSSRDLNIMKTSLTEMLATRAEKELAVNE